MKKAIAIVVLGLLLITPSLADTEESKKKSIPEWFKKIPKTTEKMVYAGGTAVSSKLEISKDKAIFAGMTALCKKINPPRVIVTEKLNADGTTTTTTTIESGECALSGYEIEKIKIVLLDNGNYRTYLILKYPVDH